MRNVRTENVRALACSISGLGKHVDEPSPFQLLPTLILPFLCATNASMQVHLLRLERLCPETRKKTWREINRLSFARFLVREIIKREVDDEINFTNPSYKKLRTRKFFLANGSKNGIRNKFENWYTVLKKFGLKIIE